MCTFGLHAFDKWNRDPEGRYWCQRCGRLGEDEYFDPKQTPPTQGPPM